MPEQPIQPIAGEEGSGVQAAAQWLANHRDAVRGAIIPYLRRQFDLTALEAIEAAKIAHRLEHDQRSA